MKRYSVIGGNLDSTFQGNRALTRYEFAAGLNAVLNWTDKLIATGTADKISQEDLAMLRKLQAEFAPELNNQRGRIDAIEARTAEVEANQFSTTTQLEGTAIFAVSDAFGEQTSDDNNTVFQQRVRLYFNTSFTGRDRLRTRIDFGNFEQFNLGTDEGRLGFETNTDGVFELGDVEYRFPVGERLIVFAEINDAGVHDLISVKREILEV